MATGEQKSSVTKSAISEGTIEITKPEEQKQDVSKINRNTKGDNTNALKDEFDPKKIAERQELASLFGELGANAIHKIAEANGWKDGSPEKIAMHAALAAVNAEIVKGNITAAAVTGGSTEALSNVILKAVGEAKGSSASAQWAAAVVGVALSSATGGDAQSGASIATNAIKNNHDLAYANNVAKQIEQNKDKDKKTSWFIDPETNEKRYVDLSLPNNYLKIGFKGWSITYDSITGVYLFIPFNTNTSKEIDSSKTSSIISSISLSQGHIENNNGRDTNDYDFREAVIGGLSVSQGAYFGVGGFITRPIGEYGHETTINEITVSLGAGLDLGTIGYNVHIIKFDKPSK